MALPFHRSTINRDPIEQLMDKIAAEIGFFEPIFAPAVASAVELAGGLSFAVVDQIRAAECPAASFQATLIAAAKRASVPAVTVEAAGASRRTSRDRHYYRSLPNPASGAEDPCALRGRNDAARRFGLHVYRNMRVPDRR